MLKSSVLFFLARRVGKRVYQFGKMMLYCSQTCQRAVKLLQIKVTADLKFKVEKFF